MNEVRPVGVDFPAIEWQRWSKPGAEGRVKIVHIDGRRLRLLELPPGFREENWCLKGHVGYVLSGEFVIEFQDREVACGPGMAFDIPDGDPHRSRGLPGAPTLVFVVDASDQTPPT